MLKETGERQVKDRLILVDFDHRMRYNFAGSIVPQRARIADIGCGIGYGSYFMACATGCSEVVGIDIADEVIQYAKTNYNHPNVNYVTKNILEESTEDLGKFDFITAFEVVEHVADSLTFLKRIRDILSEDGIVVFTTPNEDIIPFDKETFRYHIRHYTSNEIVQLIELAGLELLHHYSQNGTVVYGFPGNAFHVLVCSKRQLGDNVGQGTALPDSMLHRRMATAEQFDWLFEHFPVPELSELMQELRIESAYEEEIRREMILRKDKYLRKYAPHTLVDNPNFTGVTQMLRSGDILSQEFICNASGFCGIDFLPALYCNDFIGTIVLSLYDENNSLCAISTVSDVYDNKSILMRFFPLDDSAERKYRLEIYIADMQETSKISFYQTEQRENRILKLNEKKLEGTLTYKTYYY